MELIVDAVYVIVLFVSWFYWFYPIFATCIKRWLIFFFYSFFFSAKPLYYYSFYIMTLVIQNMTTDAINTATPLSNTTTLDDTILFEKMNRECILFPTYAKRDPQGTTTT